VAGIDKGWDAAAGLPESERLVQSRPEGDHAIGVGIVDVIEELIVLASAGTACGISRASCRSCR